MIGQEKYIIGIGKDEFVTGPGESIGPKSKAKHFRTAMEASIFANANGLPLTAKVMQIQEDGSVISMEDDYLAPSEDL